MSQKDSIMNDFKFFIKGFSGVHRIRQNRLRVDLKKLVQFSFLLIILVGFYSCEYDPILNPSNVETEGNYLTFQDMNDFERTYKMLVNGDIELPSYAKQNNYSSILQVQDDFEELANDADATSSKINEFLNNTEVLYVTEDSSVEPIIEDNAIISLLNDKGLLQIADKLYHFGRNTIRAIKVDIETGLPVMSVAEAKNFEESNEELGISVFKIERSVSDSYGSSKQGNCKSSCTIDYSSGRRMKGKLWKVNLWFIKAAGAYTKSQKKKWGFWIGTKASEIEVSVTPSRFGTLTNYRTNKKSAHLLTSFSVWGGTDNGQVPDVSTPLDGEHYVNGYTCYTCKN